MAAGILAYEYYFIIQNIIINDIINIIVRVKVQLLKIKYEKSNMKKSTFKIIKIIHSSQSKHIY